MYKEGIYKQVNANYGIVGDADSNDYFIYKTGRANAFSGDFVKIKILKEATNGKKAEAEIIKIISRTTKDLVGIFIKQKNKDFGFVRVYNTFYGKDIFIGNQNSLNAKNDDVVMVQIIGGTDKPNGAIKKVLGNKSSPQIEEMIILYSNNVRQEFEQNTLKEAQNLKQFSDYKNRTDLTNELIVTIDGADAKDLDDAISVKKLDNGNYELGVHIADVTHYVTEGSSLDREALERGTSIYTPGRVIPMLPEKISNDLCSLNPKEMKATLSIFMEIDAKTSKVINKKIKKTYIKSKARLTYDEVAEIIINIGNDCNRSLPKGQDGEIIEMLKLAFELKKIVYARRKKEGKIEFEFEEVKIEMGEDGKVKDIYKLKRNEAHKIIEEFMILANEEVSRFFSEKKIPFLYRVHEKPEETSIEELKKTLNSKGIFIDEKNINPLLISQIIDSLEGKSDKYFLSKQILQAMAKAKYMDEALGHFGLSLKYYSHFTSPIRRYPDLQIHRIIKQYLDGELSKNKLDKYKRILKKIAKQNSDSEVIAESIENKIKFLKTIEYMSDKIGRKYKATISGISPIGIYAELENGVEGFIHNRNFIKSMTYDTEQKCFIETKTNQKFTIGKPLQIQVLKADKKMGFLDFGIV
ncbi:ribonuclease R [Candidatus Gracilibacteria bacterium]|nr:ribonuclease R [Candidatus Gracilibacteria bacterium]